MNEYVFSLALSYFKEKKSNYILSELKEMLGYGNAHFEELIFKLISEEYIAYTDDLLCITSKGIKFLIANDQIDNVLESEKLLMKHIKPENALSIDTPYVPTKFEKKYNK